MVANTFVSFCTLILIIVNTLLYNVKMEAIQTKHVQSTINKASEVAADYSAELLLLEMQETEAGNITVNPEYIWYSYKYTFLRSLGVYSENNMERVEHNIPSSVISVNDGYFMRLLTVNDNQQLTYKWTQKIPFSRQTTIDTNLTHEILENSTTIVPSGSYIADTMNGRNIIVYNGSDYYRVQTDGNGAESIVGSAHSKSEIAKAVYSGITYSMNYNASPDSLFKVGGNLQMPEAIYDSLAGQQVPIIGPSIFVIGDIIEWYSSNTVAFTTVSNTQIISAPPVYCYTRDNIQLYSRIKPSDVQVEQIYSNMEQAALAGYKYDESQK